MKAILQWVLRTMMKDQTGVMRTLPRKDLVDFNVMMTAERLMRNGIDPTQLKNANQVENAIKMIDDRPAVQEGVTSTESAKVFNIKGDELDPNKPIIGGTQPGKKIDTDTFIRLAERNPQLIKQRIADKKIKKDEDSSAIESMIKAKLDKDNKEGIARIRAKQKMIEDAIDNQSPGLTGDRKYDAEIVAEDLAERMGKVYDDLPVKQRLKLYDDAYTALSKQRFKGMKKPKDADDQESSYDDGPADFDPDADNETFAQGGRAGFSKGKLVDLARRKFLKAAAGVGAGIGALKTGLLGLGKEAAPMVEAAKETVTKAPDYFFALVDKIKRFGKSVDDPVADPRVERTYRYKNYELRENAFGEPGETVVTKTDDMGEFGYKEESMRFKKGGPTEDGVVPDEYEEMTIRPDAEGKLKDVEDGIEDISEIIEEATKSAPPIKKASGGIARMLGE